MEIESDTVGLEKGAFVKLLDARKISGAGLLHFPCAGIVAREKVANDGVTQVAVYRKGIFDVIASGAITVGTPVQMAGAAATNGDNYVVSGAAVTTLLSGAVIIGTALETAADEEVFQISLDL